MRMPDPQASLMRFDIELDEMSHDDAETFWYDMD